MRKPWQERNHQASKSKKSKSTVKRLGLMLLALIVCLGLTPQIAWAGETPGNNDAAITPQAEKEATLQIVFGLDFSSNPDVALNMTYTFSEGDTLKDLLDDAVAKGDIVAYSLDSSGWLKSVTRAGGITLTNAADFATYWSTYIDGTYYDGSLGTIPQVVLQDGVYYQFAWDSWPRTLVPDWVALASEADDCTDDSVAGGGAAAGSATLAVVWGIDQEGILTFKNDPIVVVNETWDFSDGATLKDLLDLVADESWGLFDYELNSYGYLNKVAWLWGAFTIENAADWTSSWAMYIDGIYYDGSLGGIPDIPLVDGASYQFAWDSYPKAVPPDWTDLPTPGTHGPGGGITPKDPAEYPVELFSKLFNNIAALYKGTGEDWQALELAAIGNAASVNANAIIKNAVDAYNDPDTTNLQKSILALTALGIDASNVSYGGNSYNLVDKMATTTISQNTTNGKMFMLLAYASGPYVVPASALVDTDQLITQLLLLQNTDGGWSYLPGTSDPDMTAMGITALAPYGSDPAVGAAIQEALETLNAMQLPNGGFDSPYDSTPGVLNVSSTAMVIIALAAVGIDAQTWRVGTTTATPINALLTLANTTQNGFLYGGITNAMATEQGFRSLVAYQGFLKTKSAYNVYTQAKSGVVTPPKPPTPTGSVSITYSTHVQSIGWQAPVAGGKVSGTTGKGLRLEALKVNLTNTTGISGGIEYATHVQSIGWLKPVKVTTTGTSSTQVLGGLAGTTGKGLRLEAITLNLTGKLASSYDIYYRVHAQSIGWMGWAKNGEKAGTAGCGLRLEALQIVLLPAGSPPPQDTYQKITTAQGTPRMIDASSVSSSQGCSYSAVAHIQSKGDTSYKTATGKTILGTTGKGLRMEALSLTLKNAPLSGGIKYSAHVQSIGWQDAKANGQVAGTSGRSLRLEAIKISLTGNMGKNYDVYYRAHVQHFGWTGWAKNGQSCGSAGYGYRMEALQIVILPKGGEAPGINKAYFYQKK